MNANELADAIDKYLDSILEEAIHPIENVLDQSITMLRQQADRIGVLEANHKIQLDINEKALQYIAELDKALESSLALNKAQAERQ
jgi:hypothetical protein